MLSKAGEGKGLGKTQLRTGSEDRPRGWGSEWISAMCCYSHGKQVNGHHSTASWFRPWRHKDMLLSRIDEKRPFSSSKPEVEWETTATQYFPEAFQYLSNVLSLFTRKTRILFSNLTLHLLLKPFQSFPITQCKCCFKNAIHVDSSLNFTKISTIAIVFMVWKIQNLQYHLSSVKLGQTPICTPHRQITSCVSCLLSKHKQQLLPSSGLLHDQPYLSALCIPWSICVSWISFDL